MNNLVIRVHRNSQIQTLVGSDQKIRFFIGLLFLIILTLHPYIHPLETIGTYEGYLTCQWAQMAVFIIGPIILNFFILQITFLVFSQSYRLLPVCSFLLFSRDPPQYPF